MAAPRFADDAVALDAVGRVQQPLRSAAHSAAQFSAGTLAQLGPRRAAARCDASGTCR